MFLSVLSFAVSTEFSYRQTIAENENHSAANILNSFWGLFVCNTEIALDTIIFILGVRLAYGVYKIKTFTAIGRFFFDQLIQILIGHPKMMTVNIDKRKFGAGRGMLRHDQ